MYNVLYVDDEPALLELGKVFLEISGSLQIDTATSAEEAIKKLKNRIYEGIISDYQMPEMDGIVFLKYIRAHHRSLPFILFTGRGREEVVIEAFSNGADFYLQKGGEPKSQFVELEHKIKQAIDSRKVENQLRESQQRMADIIDHLPDATFAIDLDRRVIAWNRAMEEMTGVKKEEILGTRDQSYAIPFYGEKRPILLDLILKEDGETEKKYPYVIRKDNKLISEIDIPLLYGGRGAHLWFIASPLYDIRGNIIGAIESIRDVTDREKAEEALEVSEERYRAVVESQTELISRFRPDGTHLFVNGAYCHYYGRTIDELIGKRFIPAIVPEDREKIRWHFSSLTPENPAGTIEHRIIMPNGEIRWQQWNDHAIFDEQGDLKEYQSVGRDITDRKKAEDELRAAYEQITAAEEELRQQYDELKKSEEVIHKNEEKYRSILDHMQDVYYRSDTNGNLIMASPSWARLLGYETVEELYGKNIAQTFYLKADERKQFLAEIEARGYVSDYEVTLKKRDGTPVIVATSSHKYYDQSGKLLGVEGIFRNITDRKNTENELRDVYKRISAAEEELREQYDELRKSEEALQESEDTYRTIFDNTGTATVLLEENTVISLANAEFERLSGYSREEIEGKKRWTEFVVKDDLDRMLAQHRLRRERHEAALRHYEFRFVTRFGEIRNIYLTIDTIPGTKKSVASLADITEKIRAQEALKLANKKLTLLDRITGHDTLNQLTGLFGFIELARQRVDDPEVQSYLDQQKRAAEVIKGSIDFTRDYHDIGVNAPEWQNVKETIQKSAETVNLKDATLSVDVGDVEINADRLLEKVFYTLIENAVRHGEHVSGIRFSVEHSPEVLKIICEDDGIGVPVDAKEKIFLQTYFQNTGLGLFLSQEILSITGLSMTETGTYKKGARFEIAVPKGAFRFSNKIQQ